MKNAFLKTSASFALLFLLAFSAFAQAPAIVEHDAVDVRHDFARIVGRVAGYPDPMNLELFVQYGIESLSQTSEKAVIEEDGLFQAGLFDLKDQSVYSFVIFEKNSKIPATSIKKFTTLSRDFIRATLETRPFTFSAQILGQILNQQYPTMNLRVEYGPTKPDGKSDFASKSGKVEINQETGEFDITLFNLSANTEYQYRLADANQFFLPSAPQIFRTGGQTSLMVGAQVAITSPTSVSISGLVQNENPQNLKLKIRYGIESLTAEVPIPSIDLQGNFFNVAISGLDPTALYRYQIVDAEGKLAPAPENTFSASSTLREGDGGGPLITTGGTTGSGSSLITTGGTTGTTGVTGLKNPLKVDSLAGFVKSVLDIVLMIGIPIITIFIIYSGFLFVKARGNPSELETAKKTFLWTIVGAAILLASWILAQAICETVVKLGNTIVQCR